MGMGHKDVELVIQLREGGYLPERPLVIELGAQQISNSVLREIRAVEQLGRLFGARSAPPLPPPLPADMGPEGERLSPAAPSARDLWAWLGCPYASIDIDGSPGAIPLDLNFDSAPEALLGKHQLVTNFGTTEHVANQLNAFKVMHDLTAPGGVMMHCLPAQGALNHGLINYNPKFFWALARENDYRWLFFDFSASSAPPHELPENIVEAVKPFRSAIVELAATYRVQECALRVVFQKQGVRPFAPPIDVA